MLTYLLPLRAGLRLAPLAEGNGELESRGVAAPCTAQQAFASQLASALDIVCHTLLPCAWRLAPTSAGQPAAQRTASASRPASHYLLAPLFMQS